MKNEGLYGTLYGGNKTRKLELVLADCAARGKRTILTLGGTGTNHGLATAIYARAQGMKTVLVLMDQPETERVRRQLERMRRTGATLHRTGGMATTALAAPWLVVRHRFPYVLWVGGSTALATAGIVDAALEFAAQVRAGEVPEPDDVVVALGSGGTAAGLLLGLRLAGLRTRVTAVDVAALPFGARMVRWLARRTLALLRRRGAELPDVRLDGLRVEHGFLGGGYGHPTSEAEAACRLAHDTSGLELEGVYTGKAMAALAELRRGRALGPGPILYWHTYNALALPREIGP